MQGHLETWLAGNREADEEGSPVAAYIEQDFRKYLGCGILAHGLALARCAGCGYDFLIAYSCKGRGICASCNTRRMVETAAHLVDDVFPQVPVRHWVLSFPKRLRIFLAVMLACSIAYCGFFWTVWKRRFDRAVQSHRTMRGWERLFRYCARPIFASVRLHWIEKDQRLVFRLPKPMPGGKLFSLAHLWSFGISSLY